MNNMEDYISKINFLLREINAEYGNNFFKQIANRTIKSIELYMEDVKKLATFGEIIENKKKVIKKKNDKSAKKNKLENRVPTFIKSNKKKI